MPQVRQFKYLRHWTKWRWNRRGYKSSNSSWMVEMEKSLKFLCYTKVLLKLKGKFHRKPIWPTMLYETQCWVEPTRKLSIA